MVTGVFVKSEGGGVENINVRMGRRRGRGGMEKCKKQNK